MFIFHIYLDTKNKKMAVQMTHGVIFLLAIFTILNIYMVMQRYNNNHQNENNLESTKRSIIKDSTDLQQNILQINDIQKRLQRLETKSDFDRSLKEINNKTETLIERLVKTIWRPTNENKNTTYGTHRNLNIDDGDLEWLDRDGAKDLANYGDGSCPINRNREAWQKMLRYWITLAKKYNIRYFLTAGSLLGAWRDEEVIPYDQDMDIRIHIDDFDKFYPLRQRKFVWESYDDWDMHFYFVRDWRLPYDLRRRYSCKGKLVPDYEGQCSFVDPNARLIYRNWHLDLYAYTTYTDVVKFIPHSADWEYRKDEIFPLTRCNFMGIETRCPQKPVAIFKNLYNAPFKPSKICANKTFVKV
uniref:LicD/FKTN/FKRP nucleotidyltransferase domain-containing protein n=1 Tax=Clytia hemisphaerica TaxID=252671 RepID=A0A7M5V8P3_9CNID